MGKLIEVLGGCECIVGMLILFIYLVIIYCMIYFYCLLLFFGLVDLIDVMMLVVVVLIVYIFFVLEVFSVEIEEFFGWELNDLVLDVMLWMIEGMLCEMMGEMLVVEFLLFYDYLVI